MAERIVFHIDVNSAFLSWTAAHRMCVLGDGFDLRTVPSVVAGDKKIAPQHHSGQERPGEEIRHPDRRAAGKGDGKMSESGRGGAGL